MFTLIYCFKYLYFKLKPLEDHLNNVWIHIRVKIMTINHSFEHSSIMTFSYLHR